MATRAAPRRSRARADARAARALAETPSRPSRDRASAPFGELSPGAPDDAAAGHTHTNLECAYCACASLARGLFVNVHSAASENAHLYSCRRRRRSPANSGSPLMDPPIIVVPKSLGQTRCILLLSTSLRVNSTRRRRCTLVFGNLGHTYAHVYALAAKSPPR